MRRKGAHCGAYGTSPKAALLFTRLEAPVSASLRMLYGNGVLTVWSKTNLRNDDYCAVKLEETSCCVFGYLVCIGVLRFGVVAVFYLAAVLRQANTRNVGSTGGCQLVCVWG